MPLTKNIHNQVHETTFVVNCESSFKHTLTVTRIPHLNYKGTI